MSQEENKKRWIIDPKDVSNKSSARVSAWASELMHKHEHKLNNTWKHLQVVTSGTVEPEAIDVRNFYPFPDLNWVIYKYHNYWCLMLRSKGTKLATITYAKI